MPRSTLRRLAALATLLAGVMLVSGLHGCTKTAPLVLLPNAQPTIEVTQAPVSATQPFFYAYELRWAGYDTDGRIAYFRYAIDPPDSLGSDTAWVRTNENRQSFLFRSEVRDSVTGQTGRGFHTIVLEAIDDRGGRSRPEARSFTSYTISPTVQFTQPVPNNLLPPTFGPSFRLTWKGVDPDGRTTNKPVQYKYRIFSEASTDFDFLTLLVRPDAVRERYAPHFSEWDSVSGDTTTIAVQGLTPDRKYVAVVIAIDEVGSYSPVMNYNTNMLYFTVSYAGLLGPRMTIFNDSFTYTYPSGSFTLDPGTILHTEAAAGSPVRFGWSATAQAGSFVTGYRWMVDGNISNETPRTDEGADLERWSRWSPLTTGADLPAYEALSGSETHYLYVESRDNNNQMSLAVVEFTVVRPLFDKQLLLVDDTRLLGDRPGTAGCVAAPRGVWPTAAELDTFFFARGGKPWRCYPAGTTTRPGIFQGYTYDTLGTRFLPGGTLSLKTLSRYRHVVWYTDFKSGSMINDPTSVTDPQSQLRWLSAPGRNNPIGTWVAQGGQMWLFGGGGATALQANWENGSSARDVYSNADGELVAGRIMYDVFGWRSEIAAKSFAQASKPTHPIHRGPDSTDAGSLPPYLFEKSPATEPFAVYAPNRTNTTDFYQISQVGEALSKPNIVLMDADPDPDVVREVSIIDTVYETVGGSQGIGRPCMTVIRRPGSPQTHVFSGFQLWYWRRDSQIALVDWVLQRLWGLPRENVAR